MKTISEHFSLDEFIYSRAAISNGIDNMPPQEAVERINALVSSLLQPLRLLYGKPVAVTSGYRCEELNRLVKGAANSQHMKGEAADIYVADQQLFRSLLLSKDCPAYDQAIWYPKRGFFHLSFTTAATNRRQYMEL